MSFQSRLYDRIRHPQEHVVSILSKQDRAAALDEPREQVARERRRVSCMKQPQQLTVTDPILGFYF